jgi:hypothetical protein
MVGSLGSAGGDSKEERKKSVFDFIHEKHSSTQLSKLVILQVTSKTPKIKGIAAYFK